MYKHFSLGSRLQLIWQWKDMHWFLERTALEHWPYRRSSLLLWSTVEDWAWASSHRWEVWTEKCQVITSGVFPCPLITKTLCLFPQFTIYASYFSFIAVVFSLRGLFTIWTARRRTKDSISPEKTEPLDSVQQRFWDQGTWRRDIVQLVPIFLNKKASN